MLSVMVPAIVRERYGKEIASKSGITSPALLRAFVSVPRERFVGPSPWKMLSQIPGQIRSQIIEVTDPATLYQDASILLDASRMLANGAPGTVAPGLEALDLSSGKSVFHLGCGTGYYTAIMAEVVGPTGQVRAVEIDPGLAADARSNLADYANVEVAQGDGAVEEVGPSDAILIHAGVTHPADSWLESLCAGGVLVLPLTVEFGKSSISKGMLLRVARCKNGYAAQFIGAPVMIYSCSGCREPGIERLLGKALMSGNQAAVKSLRRRPHAVGPECWLHTPTFCLSTCRPSDV
jgi:protein-L-isoaspartate(D-aspartate) O-methyltransferase